MRNRKIQVGLVLCLFCVVGVVRHLGIPGADLSSSYVGCRLMAAGEQSHLYAHDPMLFNVVGDPVWTQVAEQAHFKPLSLLHPYVQTPLWAYALQPLCRRTNFPLFNGVFLVTAMLCFALTIWLVATHWAPRLFHPGWIALLCICLHVFQPFKYLICLVQTHIIFVLLTVAALMLARRHPVWAGCLLAVAAAVKITPGFLLLYWLTAKQLRAALSFVVCSIGLLALTLVTTGSALMLTYLRVLSELSRVLLLAFNNQSLAAWWMGGHATSQDLFAWRIYALPSSVRIVSMVLVIGCTVAGGWMDHMSFKHGAEAPPFGAIFAMLAAMIFTPIAWDHYYVLLLIPMMLILDSNLQRRSLLLLGGAVTMFMLNVYPIAFEAYAQHYKAFSIVRSQFYAGVIALGLLVYLSKFSRTVEGAAINDPGTLSSAV